MTTIKKVLGIETSCDDTSVSVVDMTGYVHVLVSANQDLAHQPFGGVVPEIASRNHSETLLPLIEHALNKIDLNFEDIDALAVTNRPGLLGSLLVGVVTAKTLALNFKKPFLGINHLEAHLLAPFLFDSEFAKSELHFPYVALAVSGGHTQLYVCEGIGRYKIIGRTLDDAAGEAFDKFAKMLGLGFPGGIAVDRLAKEGNPKSFDFPRAIPKSFDFSFSGLKAAAARQLGGMNAIEIESQKANLCASFQEAIVDSLISKLSKAACDSESVVITGGVSANSRLRLKAQEWAASCNKKMFIPPPRYCTDNGAMVAYVGAQRMAMGQFSTQELGPLARLSPQEFQ